MTITDDQFAPATAAEWTERFYAPEGTPALLDQLDPVARHNVQERAKVMFLAQKQRRGLLIREEGSTDWVAFAELLGLELPPL